MEFKGKAFCSEYANSFVRHTVCRQENRFHYIDILKHPFVYSVIQKVKDTYNTAEAIILSDDQKFKPFYDNVNFFEPIEGVPFGYEENEPPSNVSQSDISSIHYFPTIQFSLANDNHFDFSYYFKTQNVEPNEAVLVVAIVNNANENEHVSASVISFFNFRTLDNLSLAYKN